MKDELQNAVRFFIISHKPSSKIYYTVLDFIKSTSYIFHIST